MPCTPCTPPKFSPVSEVKIELAVLGPAVSEEQGMTGGSTGPEETGGDEGRRGAESAVKAEGSEQGELEEGEELLEARERAKEMMLRATERGRDGESEATSRAAEERKEEAKSKTPTEGIAGHMGRLPRAVHSSPEGQRGGRRTVAKVSRHEDG